MIATIITPWIGDGTKASPYHPKITDDYPTIYRYVDTTVQPSANLTPAPNLFIGQFEMDAVTLALIEADDNYFVLWNESNG